MGKRKMKVETSVDFEELEHVLLRLEDEDGAENATLEITERRRLLIILGDEEATRILNAALAAAEKNPKLAKANHAEIVGILRDSKGRPKSRRRII